MGHLSKEASSEIIKSLLLHPNQLVPAPEFNGAYKLRTLVPMGVSRPPANNPERGPIEYFAEGEKVTNFEQPFGLFLFVHHPDLPADVRDNVTLIAKVSKVA